MSMPCSVQPHQAATCMHQFFACLSSIDLFQEIKVIDWYNEFRLVATAVLVASVIVRVILFVEVKYPISPIWVKLENWIRLPNWIWLRRWALYFNLRALLPKSEIVNPSRGRTLRCPPPRIKSSPYEPSHRTILTDTNVLIYGWPSQGGVIILDHAEAVDLEFLGLDTLNPPSKRLTNQPDEDAFCQGLLLLGAKWWDSEARFQLLAAVMGADHESPQAIRASRAIEEETEPNPSIKERRWVSVAWPTTGGLWVAEFDTNVCGFIDEEDNLVPDEVVRLKLARTMNQRTELLQNHFEAKFYANLSDYKGHAFLNSWEEKISRDVGPLMKQSI